MENLDFIKRVKRLFAVALVFFLLGTIQGCGYFNKPSYEGQVIDYETNEPIEGASVIATYRSETTTIIAGDATAIVDVQEAITDKDGRFFIPPYTSVIYPISREGTTLFGIFKPGYYPAGNRSFKGCFTGGACARQEMWASPPRERPVLLPDYVVENGKVGLTKIVSERDRRVLIPSGVHLYESKSPYLMKLINEEYKKIWN